MRVSASPTPTTAEHSRSAQADRGTVPSLERQIHRACGDVRAALSSALALLSETTDRCAGHSDVFRTSSDLAHLQDHVAVALQATNLLDQMVVTPAQHRKPWSYFRGRIRQEAPLRGDPTSLTARRR